jgi:hypothetical protein
VTTPVDKPKVKGKKGKITRDETELRAFELPDEVKMWF